MHRGQVICKSTKLGNYRAAIDMEATHKTALAKGDLGILEKKPAPTLVGFGKEFLVWATAQFREKPKTLAFYQNGIRRLSEYQPLASLVLDDERIKERLTDYITKRQTPTTVGEKHRKALQVSSINRELQVLRRLLNLAVERKRINSAPKIEMLSGERHRELVLTPAEQARYLAAASPLLFSVATVLVNTGLRLEECYRLRWESISWDGVIYQSGGWEAESVAIGDVNGDGHPDLVVANFCLTYPSCNNGGIVSVLLNNGNGTFRAAVTYGSGGDYSYAVSVADVNGDGDPDLVVLSQCVIGSSNCGSAKGVVGVLLGNGEGAFRAAVIYSSGGSYPVSIAIADVNGDGKPDLLVSNECTTTRCTGTGAIGTVGVLLNNLTVTTTTQVTSSLNPSPINQPVTFTATVTSSSSVPNGSTLTFYAGTTKLGIGTTTNGVATLTTSFSKARPYTVKAKYAGDVFHKPSNGTLMQVVNL